MLYTETQPKLCRGTIGPPNNLKRYDNIESKIQLRTAKHWYIDCTFVVPPSFKQMLVIMYRDDNSGVRYPGLFGLINNKKQEGYMCLFKSIKDIITLDNYYLLKFDYIQK